MREPTSPLTRRRFAAGLAAGAAALLGAPHTARPATDWRALGEAEWRERLTGEEFRILREAGTEAPWSSALLEERRPGTFACAGCARALFSSETKYDSGTGWPSFWRPLEGAVGTREDRAFFLITQTECHCTRCAGHLGHVFEDGPPPTGLRYCINGVALDFVAAAGAS